MSVALNPEILLTSRDLAARWALSPNAIQAMRRRGTGPRFTRIGPKRVRYKLADVLAFEQSFTSLSESRAGDPKAQALAEKQRERFNRVRPMAMKRRLLLAAKRRKRKQTDSRA